MGGLNVCPLQISRISLLILSLKVCMCVRQSVSLCVNMPLSLPHWQEQ